MIDNEKLERLISQVLANEDDQWVLDYYAIVIPFLRGTETFEGGEIVAACRNGGLRNPHHPNVWPASVGRMRANGLIEKIGVSSGSRSPYSHDRRGTTVWRSLLWEGQQ